jgi:hypothetical protein
MSAEFDLEWFCGELVGMTTRAGAMESIGIPSTRSHAYWTLLPSPTALDFGHSGGRRARRAFEALGSGTGRSCARGIPSNGPIGPAKRRPPLGCQRSSSINSLLRGGLRLNTNVLGGSADQRAADSGKAQTDPPPHRSGSGSSPCAIPQEQNRASSEQSRQRRAGRDELVPGFSEGPPAPGMEPAGTSADRRCRRQDRRGAHAGSHRRR